jgi:VanZ family protein
LQWATLAFLCTSLVAILDEWNQSFLLSRTGTFRDVILDGSAGFVAQITLFAILRMQRPSVKRSVLPEIDAS